METDAEVTDNVNSKEVQYIENNLNGTHNIDNNYQQDVAIETKTVHEEPCGSIETVDTEEIQSSPVDQVILDKDQHIADSMCDTVEITEISSSNDDVEMSESAPPLIEIPDNVPEPVELTESTSEHLEDAPEGENVTEIEVPENATELVILHDDGPSELTNTASNVEEISTDQSTNSDKTEEQPSSLETSCLSNDTKLMIEEIDESVSLPPAEPLILCDDKVAEEVPEQSVPQYTVLPPGENAVYQEDGTLVVEYPIENTIQIETPEEVTTTEEVSEKKEEPKQQKARGRKPNNTIPMHIIGHDIDKPIQETPNGKKLVKPRLGVKVPGRTLVSQIVSTTELRQEIIDRAKQKQESKMLAQSSIAFTKQLTHRLAQSLSGIKPKKEDNSITTKLSKVTSKTTKDVENNSDLIAILEGDGEEMSDPSELSKPIIKPDISPVNSLDIKEIEREILLTEQKKTDPPVKEKKFFKSRESRLSVTPKDKPKVKTEKPDVDKPSTGDNAKSKLKSKEGRNADEKPVKSVVVEVEPQLKPLMALKTYTRKRKSDESLALETPKKFITPPNQTDIDLKPTPPASDVYMTKSSRIIKKKIIWDPDEALPSVRNQSKILSKIEATVKMAQPKQSSPKVIEKEKTSPTVTAKKVHKSPVEQPPVAKKNKPSTEVKEAQADTPSKSSDKNAKKSTKRLTEIDKLLMDEGAVNMLYDINNSDELKRRASARNPPTNHKAQTQKEILNKTQEIKNELTSGLSSEPSKTLRKKESVTPEKKEMSAPATTPVSKKSSKDVTKSQSPPPLAADASRIIRRHSSSSFSSNDDFVQETLEEKEKSVKTVATREQPPKDVEQLESSPRKKKRTTAKEVTEPQPPVEISIKCEPVNITGELKTDPGKPFTVVKMNKHYLINLTYSGSDNYLTVQLLKDLTVTLKELGKNKNCTVVSLLSQGRAFCLGLDYKGLVESNEDLRRKRATELSNCVREFFKCLVTFPKVLVAGVKGDCVGLGVMMLPLFDIVAACDVATFSTPYSKLGTIPEGGFLLSTPFVNNHSLGCELLFTTQRMTADEAQKKGLVGKLFWPEKFDAEFRSLMAHISNQSKLSLVATKKQLRQYGYNVIEANLSTSCKSLIDFWIGDECQKNFTNYNALTFDIDQ